MTFGTYRPSGLLVQVQVAATMKSSMVGTVTGVPNTPR